MTKAGPAGSCRVGLGSVLHNVLSLGHVSVSMLPHMWFCWFFSLSAFAMHTTHAFLFSMMIGCFRFLHMRFEFGACFFIDVATHVVLLLFSSGVFAMHTTHAALFP